MIHLTLNTGNAASVPPGQVRPATICAMQPILRGGNLGQVSPQFAAFRVEVTRQDGAAAFTLYRGMEPIALNVVCWSPEAADTAWDAIERPYLALSDDHLQLMAPGEAPDMPGSVPWLATCILPGILHQTRDNIGWLADFAQCMAQALIHYAQP